MDTQSVQAKKTVSYSVLIASWVVILWGVIEAKRFLVTIMGAILFAFILMPLMRFLKRHKLPEWLSLTIVILVLVLPILLLADAVLSEVHSLGKEWPALQASFYDKLNPWIQNISADLGVSSPLEKARNLLSSAMHWMIESLLTVFSLGAEFSLMAIFAVVGIGSRWHLRRSLERTMLEHGDSRSMATLDRASEVLEKFLMARLSIIIFVAVVDFVIIKAMGLNYAVISSLILGLSTLIPAVGFFLGALPAVSVALAAGKSPTQVVILFLSIWIVASIQDHFLAPKLLGKHLNLNFLVTYLAIFAGERIWGVAGMFLSVPVLAVIQVVLSSSARYRPLTWLLQGHEADEKKGPNDLADHGNEEPHTVHV